MNGRHLSFLLSLVKPGLLDLHLQDPVVKTDGVAHVKLSPLSDSPWWLPAEHQQQGEGLGDIWPAVKDFIHAGDSSSNCAELEVQQTRLLIGT